MKYVFSWTFRLGGSAADNEAGVKRLLEVFSKWTIPASTTYHQFVSRVDGNGGFAVVETDNPMDLVRDVGKFGPFLEYQVYPVVEVAEAVEAVQGGVEFRG
jgi:Protein of unknown function (DUF3303)